MGCGVVSPTIIFILIACRWLDFAESSQCSMAVWQMPVPVKVTPIKAVTLDRDLPLSFPKEKLRAEVFHLLALC